MAPYLLCAITLLLLYEQLSYLKKKGPLPGPTLILPFIGSAIPMILNPTNFWRHQASSAAASTSGLSANYLFGRFTLFIRSTDLSHLVFSNVRPDAFHLIGHPFGKKLFGDHNLHIHQSVILSHLSRWLSLAADPQTPIKLRFLCRDLNLDTSQTVFAGPYLSAEARRRFNEDYNLFNVGLMALPFDLPGFAFRRARLAVSRLVSTLSSCAASSKARILAGEEPSCLVDFWMQDEIREAEPASADEIGGHLFDFLFAAQDASTSSLLWAVALLEAHPDVLGRVRAEVSAVWDPLTREPISAAMIRGFKYTESVAREVVRFRPPATMVPHIAGEPFRLTENYVVPKGAIVFPSAYESSFQGFTEPDRFDPDRFAEGREEDRVFKRNFLAFGAGPHQCVGQRYALNHLVLFIALFVSLVDFRRHRTDGCDEISYVPTIVPKDDCQVYISPRFPGFSFS
ncbi:hypothetical protein J5N97_001249 [Dioscorea zingiberensis]|uniref:sterol 22-desaturase n=1 Tax=Dioscorea zingiberensis TaxID=325984 RepID=A0A9D5BU67_9LILI|nr:hypothetical protein J5N97_001249 [Dioscorea zingiberensis]